MEEKENLKNRIRFIIPYFGSFNSLFPLFLQSCEKNKGICDWLIFTDDKSIYEYPTNVHVVYMEWMEMQQLIQSKFDFDVKIEKPYKLCDYRASYGYIFEDYLIGYGYWGHCDIDLIWGYFKNFWEEEIMRNYPKIFNLGHCTIYQNNKENNQMFMKAINGKERYKEVFSSYTNCSFDEEYRCSINNIYEEYNIPIFEKSYAANLYTKTSNFRLTKMNEYHEGYIVEPRKKNFFVWNDGRLIRYLYENHIWSKQEYLYIHFQARKMKINLQGYDNRIYKIIPNSIDELEISIDKLDGMTDLEKIKTKHFNLHYFKLRSKNLVNKMKRRFYSNII